jgi:hypothetical protein
MKDEVALFSEDKASCCLKTIFSDCIALLSAISRLSCSTIFFRFLFSSKTETRERKKSKKETEICCT